MPMEISVEASVGDTLLDAALDNGIPMLHDCGGNCACTTCHLRVLEGAENLSRREEVEAHRLDTADNRTETSRLGCQAILRAGDVTVLLMEEESLW